ncbi:MAG TPA: hypothetical protein VFM79_01780 [Pelobium sp.]|nr:hypothetical protein [Pelobium sp.]
MKTKLQILTASAFVLLCGAQMAKAQTEVANVRPYDKSGINVFEAPKDSTAVFEKIKVKFGAGFTQSFQGLKHENSNTTNIPANELYKITPGFNTANANLFMNVQLADGILLNLTSYLSSRHHNETWVKGGYIQFDKLPFKGEVWENIMKYATLKVGHMEINYGDQHFRRSDGGHTLYNPFAENYILDGFTTEIGGELLLRKDMFFGVIGASNGMIKGNIDELTPTAQDDNIKKNPSIYLKAGVDKQVTTDLRLRLAASYYTNTSSGGQTLYGGDRTGSNYFMVMEKVGGTAAANAFSGRLNPGFSKKVEAIQLNAFAKFQGLELFGTYETTSGRTKAETAERDVNQFAIDGVYRIGKAENVFIGARYNVVKAELAGIANEVEVNRVAVGAGWFLTNNILLKGEYVTQKYKDFPVADYRAGGEFSGYVIQAVVGF